MSHFTPDDGHDAAAAAAVAAHKSAAAHTTAIAEVRAARVYRPRTEHARERDVYRFLHPWTDIHKPPTLDRSPFPRDASEPMPDPTGCPDAALAAFAQLGALRLNVRRCLVTLVTTHVEYVLAESSRTMSLQYDSVEDERDKTWIGTCSFLRDEGITDIAMPAWRKARSVRERPEDNEFYYTEGCCSHYCLISDVRKNEECAERPFAQRGGRPVRFFYSVPLRDSFGTVIGSFAVIDDRPRYGVSLNEMAFMEDMADTVTEHLESSIIRSQRQRSERLIQGLGLFNSGKESLRHWWLGQDNARMRKAGRHADNPVDLSGEERRMNDEFGTRESSDSTSSDRMDIVSSSTRNNISALQDRDHEDVISRDFDQSATKKPEQLAPPPKSHRSRHNHQSSDWDLTTERRGAFSRASNLMREALNAEGVVFVKADLSTGQLTRFQGTSSEGTQEGSASEGMTPMQTTSDGETSSDAGTQYTSSSSVNGYSTRQKSSLVNSKSSLKFKLPHPLLAHLIRQYPRGKVFNFEEGGGVYSSSGEDGQSGSAASAGSTSEDARRKRPRRATQLHKDGSRLGKLMTGARTIAFYPLWDDVHDQFTSVTFVWSITPNRFFDPDEDITYLASFGHSLMAELARLDAMAADKAKGTFISSISHELRSPLHGILAGVEFLQESELTAFQREMSFTISMAGKTLLDTVNHILDFSKISSFSKEQRQNRVVKDAARLRSNVEGDDQEVGVTSYVDLAQLTEEVVETIVSAHRFHGPWKTATESSANRNTSQKSRIATAESPSGEFLSVVLNISPRESWVAEISPGSWTRILTNVVGNALKYTNRGFVSVRLDLGGARSGPDCARLIIEDTGIGMSEQFLANDVYTPFKQEDTHTSGTGLGLSIVKKITADMNANLSIVSKPSQGTRVTIAMDCKFGPPPASNPVLETIRETGLHALNIVKLDQGETNPFETSSVATSVLESARDWLGCEVSTSSQFTTGLLPSVHAVEEVELTRLAAENPEHLRDMLSTISEANRNILVLGTSLQSIASNFPFLDTSITPVFVHQPIGPQKLMRAIASAKLSKSFDVDDLATAKVNAGIRPQLNRNLTSFSNLSADDRPGVGQRLISEDGKRPISWRSSGSPPELKRPKIKLSPSSPGFPFTSPPLPGSANGSPDMGSLPFRQVSSTVLLVEDNDINMKLLVALMQKMGVNYECASNGLIAVEKYSASPSSFFLILMDMSMPVMDGFQSTAEIRQVEKKKRSNQPCMIVALTGVTDAKARERASKAGVDKFFTKPVRMKELSELIDEIQPGREGVRDLPTN